MNARASGTPAKFEATPENVRSRRGTGRAARRDHGVGQQEPEDPPRIAVTRLISMLVE